VVVGDTVMFRERDITRAPGFELGGDSHRIGRDPRKMTQAELRHLGHEPKSVIQALRERCLDCCAGRADEVRKCMAVFCPAWPFRMGENPWRTVSEGRRQAGRRLAAKRATRALNRKSDLPADAGTGAAVLGEPADA
jgi:hypothetical protein